MAVAAAPQIGGQGNGAQQALAVQSGASVHGGLAALAHNSELAFGTTCYAKAMQTQVVSEKVDYGTAGTAQSLS